MNGQLWQEMFVIMWERDGDPRIRFQLDDAAEINAHKTNGRTLLSHAAECGNLDIIKFLVQNGADGNVADSDGYTPIHISAIYDRVDAVKFFLDAGILIDIRDNSGATPLYLAVAFSRISVVEYLIKAGADVKCCRTDGWTMLHLVCDSGWRCACSGACDSRWRTVVNSLLCKGCDPNAKNSDQCTPLHYAIKNRHFCSVTSLLEAGAYNQCFVRCFGDWVSLPRELVSLKRHLLQNPELYTLAILNKFNNIDLPKIYRIQVLAKLLPPMEKFKITIHSDAARDITSSLKYEIREKRYINVLKGRPFSLSSFCIRTLSQFYG